MSAELNTPEKVYSESSNLTPDTVKHIKNSGIFSISSKKAIASPISQRRYIIEENNLFDKSKDTPRDSDLDSKKTYKLLNFSCINPVLIEEKENNREEFDRVLSSLRNNELTDKVYENKGTAHIRHISDTDSVIYIGSEDDRSGNKIYNLTSNDKRDSLITLGNTPCTAYCRHCRVDVHTIVEFHNAKISQKMARIFSSVFSCCSLPVWLSKLRVHKCPNCFLIIAKCR